jgi:hypothetical protein
VNTTDELSPMMKIFTWRGDHAVAPETPASAATDAMPIVTEAAPSAASSASFIEIRLAGAVVHFVPGADPALLTDVLHAVRNSASMPPRSHLPLP